MNYKLLKKNVLAVAITATLATGCGGGSSNSITNTNNSSIEGAASKGIMKNAIVKAFKLTSTGEKDGAAFAETTTKDDGTYSLTGLASTGTTPILIELSVESGVTTMVCDALAGCGTTAYNVDFPLPDDFVLRAVLPPLDGGSANKAQITPFSEFATARALASTSGVTQQVVSSAISEVNGIFGINLQTTQPVNISGNAVTGGDEQQQYGLFNAAFADLAFTDADANGSVDAADLIANLKTFADDFKDGVLGNNGTGLGLDPRKLFDQVKTQVNDAKNSALSSKARQDAEAMVDTLIGQVKPDGSFDPEPSPTVGQNDNEVTQAKKLVDDIRQKISELQDLKSPTELFGDEVETLATNLDGNTVAVVEVLTNVLSQVATAVDNSNTFADIPSSLTISGKNGIPVNIGTVSITSSNTNGKTILAVRSNAPISGVDIDTTLELNQVLNENTPIIPTGTVALTVSGSASNASVQLTLAQSIFTVVLASDFNINGNEDAVVNQASLKGGTLEIAEKSNNTLTGAKLSGRTDIEAVRLTNNNGSVADSLNLSLKKLVATDFTVTSAQGVNTAGLNISLVVNNAETFDTLALLNGTKETADNFLNVSLSISGNLKLAQNPEASVSLVVNKTGLEKGDATLTLAFDGRSLTVGVSGDNATSDSTTATITVSNPDGVELSVTGKEKDTKGTIKVNDKVIGTIEEVNGVVLIRYNDGSFESL